MQRSRMNRRLCLASGRQWIPGYTDPVTGQKRRGKCVGSPSRSQRGSNRQNPIMISDSDDDVIYLPAPPQMNVFRARSRSRSRSPRSGSTTVSDVRPRQPIRPRPVLMYRNIQKPRSRSASPVPIQNRNRKNVARKNVLRSRSPSPRPPQVQRAPQVQQNKNYIRRLRELAGLRKKPEPNLRGFVVDDDDDIEEYRKNVRPRVFEALEEAFPPMDPNALRGGGFGGGQKKQKRRSDDPILKELRDCQEKVKRLEAQLMQYQPQPVQQRQPIQVEEPVHMVAVRRKPK